MSCSRAQLLDVKCSDRNGNLFCVEIGRFRRMDDDDNTFMQFGLLNESSVTEVRGGRVTVWGCWHFVVAFRTGYAHRSAQKYVACIRVFVWMLILLLYLSWFSDESYVLQGWMHGGEAGKPVAGNTPRGHNDSIISSISRALQ